MFLTKWTTNPVRVSPPLLPQYIQFTVMFVWIPHPRCEKTSQNTSYMCPMFLTKWTTNPVRVSPPLYYHKIYNLQSCWGDFHTRSVRKLPRAHFVCAQCSSQNEQPIQSEFLPPLLPQNIQFTVILVWFPHPWCEKTPQGTERKSTRLSHAAASYAS